MIIDFFDLTTANKLSFWLSNRFRSKRFRLKAEKGSIYIVEYTRFSKIPKSIICAIMNGDIEVRDKTRLEYIKEYVENIGVLIK